MWMQTLLHKFSSTIVFNFCFYSLSLTFTHTHITDIFLSNDDQPTFTSTAMSIQTLFLLFLLPPKKYTFHFHSSEKNDLINCFAFFPFSTFISSPLMTQELRASTANCPARGSKLSFLMIDLPILHWTLFSPTWQIYHIASLIDNFLKVLS